MDRKVLYKRSSYGFTLAELLIVVAIIAVLVGIAVPMFTKQLERSREATDLANVRSAYAQLMTTALMGETPEAGSAITKSGDVYALVYEPLVQKVDDWQSDISSLSIGGVSASDTSHWKGKPKAGGKCTITIDLRTSETTIVWGSGYGLLYNELPNKTIQTATGDWYSMSNDAKQNKQNAYNAIMSIPNEQRVESDLDVLRSIAAYFNNLDEAAIIDILGENMYNRARKDFGILFAYQVDGGDSYSVRLNPDGATRSTAYLDDLGYSPRVYSNGDNGLGEQTNKFGYGKSYNYVDTYLLTSDQVIGKRADEHQVRIKLTDNGTKVWVNGTDLEVFVSK
jgi:prepilin-type N-terminal cleavage/methylation domain-containing protein